MFASGISKFFKISSCTFGVAVAVKAIKAIFSPLVYSYLLINVHKDKDGKNYFGTETKPHQLNKNAFNGKLYVLINGASFSASSILSTNLKGAQRATFVGEETGGDFNGTVAGFMPVLKMRYSKLNFRIGVMNFEPFYQTATIGHGIYPDVHIQPTLKDKIEKNKELGILSKKLARILLDCPVTFNAEDFELSKPDVQKTDEIFMELENLDPMKSKQLDKGIHQLTDEGVAQMFIMQPGNRKIVGTVGQLQFEVIQYRLINEYGANCRFTPRNFTKAVWITTTNQEQLDSFKRAKANYLATDKDGNMVFLAETQFLLQMAEQDYPDITFHKNSEFKLEV